jgi:hypothetical protein
MLGADAKFSMNSLESAPKNGLRRPEPKSDPQGWISTSRLDLAHALMHRFFAECLVSRWWLRLIADPNLWGSANGAPDEFSKYVAHRTVIERGGQV